MMMMTRTTHLCNSMGYLTVCSLYKELERTTAFILLLPTSHTLKNVKTTIFNSVGK